MANLRHTHALNVSLTFASTDQGKGAAAEHCWPATSGRDSHFVFRFLKMFSSCLLLSPGLCPNARPVGPLHWLLALAYSSSWEQCPARVHMCVCVCVCVGVYVRVYMSGCGCGCGYGCGCGCGCALVCVCMRPCVHVCVYVCMHV